jgi:hypothetical protein
MSEVDPDPYEPGEGRREVELGGAGAGGQETLADDPTQGGKHGEIGSAPSVAADEPDLGSYPVGGGNVTEEADAAPVDDPGPSA